MESWAELQFSFVLIGEFLVPDNVKVHFLIFQGNRCVRVCVCVCVCDVLGPAPHSLVH